MHRNEEQERQIRDDQMGGMGREQDNVDSEMDRDTNLQREGNLANERNSNEPDMERRPGGNRENMNR